MPENNTTPGYMFVTVLITIFIITAAAQRMKRPVLWDADTATISAPDDVLAHWPDGMININRAAEAELCLLPGIGPARARAIIEDRTRHGEYQTIDELDRVDGIGLKTIGWFDDYIVLHR